MPFAVARRALAAAAALTLLTIPSVSAESVVADGDTVSPGVQGTIDLGTVQPGADVHVDLSFVVTCTGTNHVDAGQSVRLTSGLRSIPAGGGFSVTGLTFGLPAGWPADGATCPADLQPATGGPIHMIVTAPTTPGIDYRYQFSWNRSVIPAGTNDSATYEGTNPSVVFLLDVPEPPPPNSPPTLNLPASSTVEGNTTGGATAAYTVTAADTEDAVAPTPSCSPAAGALLPLGTTTVTCSVTDSGSLTTTGSFTITVVDTTAPSLAGMPADVNLTTTTDGAALTYAAPTASDVVDPAPTVGCVPASGSTIPVGDTTVTCTAHDASGKTSSASFVAHVTHEAPPPPPPADARALWSDPVPSSGHLVVNRPRNIPVKVRLMLGDDPYAGNSAALTVTPCAGGSSVATVGLSRQDSGRWVGHVSTGALMPGCYRVAARAGDQVFGAFTLDVRGHGAASCKGHGSAKKKH